MGALEKLLALGGAALVFYGISSARKAAEYEEEKRLENARKEEIEKLRLNIPFCYPDYLSDEQFERIVMISIKPMKRKFSKLEIANGKIYGTIISQSGISEWRFIVDFNDFGKLTGKYWLFTENSDSSIPKRVAETVRFAVCQILDENSLNTNSAFDNENSDDSSTTTEKKSNESLENKNIEILRKPSWADKHKRGIIITILIVILSVFALLGYIEYTKFIPIGYNKATLIGINYLDVVNKLENAGFECVVTREVEDLPLNKENKVSLVTDVVLEEKTTFDKDTKYKFDKRIVVVYHSLKMCEAPVLSKDAKGMDYADVKDKFEVAGFENIKTYVLYDVITGWITGDGEVKSITIDDNEDYTTYEDFRPDAEVIITYHSYIKNKPN